MPAASVARSAGEGGGRVYLNAIGTAVPEHDIHAKFVEYCPQKLIGDEKSRRLFRRMAQRAQIDHRYSILRPHPDGDCLDADGFYEDGRYPDTCSRMKMYERHAFPLARRALDQIDDLGSATHLIVTTCTGFYAPGLDLQIRQHYGLPESLERTVIGFMGCYAAMNALKLARHIVRSDAEARVVILSLELCTLHLKPSGSLEEMLSMLLFADGCAASMVSAQPQGIELSSFSAAVIPESDGLITWHIGELGFDMRLSGAVPAAIAEGLPARLDAMLDGHQREAVSHWAIHPGGRTILDAVREGGGLDESRLSVSRNILSRFGNMSSPTIMFVLNEILRNPGAGGPGCALAFGPGLTVESMCFQTQAA